MTKGSTFVIVLVIVTIFERPFHLCEPIKDESRLTKEDVRAESTADHDSLQSVHTEASSIPVNTKLNPALSGERSPQDTRAEQESSQSDSVTVTDVQPSTDSIPTSLPVSHSIKPPSSSSSASSQVASEQPASENVSPASSDSPAGQAATPSEGTTASHNEESSARRPDLLSDNPSSAAERGESLVVEPESASSQSSEAVSPDQQAVVKPPQDSAKSPGEVTVEQVLSPSGEATVTDGVKDDHHEVEEFPSYSEWKQKELEKQKTQQKTVVPPTASVIKPKLRVDYASKHCGAKIIATNPEADNVQGVLSPSQDEYMINPCSAKKWFVLELCEPVQVKSVEIASLELFSSQPKAFTVLVSDRNPAKEWRQVGSFEATEDKAPQWFPTNDEQFVKFIKVELLNHYGNEHFCPVTLFRVFGIPMDDDDDDHEQPEPASVENVKEVLKDDEVEGDKESVKNLFTSAKDTVVKLVKTVLNVDLEHGHLKKAESKDQDMPSDVSDGNYSADGQLLPCDPARENEKGKKDIPTVIVPTASIPKVPIGKETDVSEKSTPESSETGTASKEKSELPLVTKLTDNEQVPSEKSKRKVPRSLRDSLSECHRLENNVTSPHRMICSYVQTMLGNQITQTCCRDTSSGTPPSSIELTAEISHAASSIEGTTSDIPQSPVESRDIDSKAGSSLDDPIQPSLSAEKLLPSSADFTSPMHSQSILHSNDKSFQHEATDGMSKVEDVVTRGSVPESTTVESFEPRPDESADGDLPVLQSSLSLADSPDPTASSRPTPELSMSESRIVVDNTAGADMQSLLVSKVMPTPTTVTMHSLDEGGGYPQTVGASVEGHQGREGGGASREEGAKEHADEKASAGGRPAGDAQGVVKAPNVTHTASEVNLKPVDLVQIPGLPVAKHRETAIMRLTNRIKALELNVSLSSRFLDELSQRFKKQLDDMLKQMTNVSRNSDTKDEVHRDQLDVLETRVDNLTQWVRAIAGSLDALADQLTDRQMVWASIEFLMLAITCLVCLTRGTPSPASSKLQGSPPPSHSPVSGKSRRNSDIGTVGHEVLPVLLIKKQSSETMLAKSSVQNVGVAHKRDAPASEKMLAVSSVQNIGAAYKMDVPASEQAFREGPKKKKRKKHKNLEAKSSADMMQESKSKSSSSATQLNRCAGLLFGADAVNSLTGKTDAAERNMNVCEREGSTTSLPCSSCGPQHSPTLVDTPPGSPREPGSCPRHRKTFQPSASVSGQSITNGFSEGSDSPVEFPASFCLDEIEPVSVIKTETKGYRKWVEWKKTLGFK